MRQRWTLTQIAAYVLAYGLLLGLAGVVLQWIAAILMPERPIVWWSMLLKPLVAIALLAGVFGSAWALMAILRRTLPDSRLKRRLFQPWNRRSAD